MKETNCPKCGASVPEGSAFCQSCGSPLPSQPEQPGEQSYSAPQPPYTAPGQQSYASPEQQPPYTAPGQQPPYAPSYGPAGAPVPPGYQQKSRVAAGVLGILLGGLGIHNFYLGYTQKALIQLLVSLLTCGIGALPMEIWGLVEGIQILTGSISVDAHGVPLRD